MCLGGSTKVDGIRFFRSEEMANFSRQYFGS